MKSDPDSALKVAEFLLQIKAVKLNIQQPYVWASGWNSPIYCDNRKTLSFPTVRTFIRQEFVRAISDRFGKPDLIAGVATGGIAHGVLVAQELGVPFAYVRSAPKAHGLGNLIEGVVESGQNVVVVEDLISTGKSSLNAVDALRQAGCEVKGMSAIFTYDFDLAKQAFEEQACPLVTLSNYPTLIEKAISLGYIGEGEREALEAWRKSPHTWKKPALHDH